MGTYTGEDKRLQYLFQNGGGGGGTTVIANPQGQATDILNKLQVGQTIYSVPSGGGGSIITYHANWTATASTVVNTKLTEELTLPAGKYIAFIHNAYSSNSNMGLFCLSINDAMSVNAISNTPISYGNSALFFELSSQSRVVFATASQLSMTWDAAYISRGGMDIIKVA